MRLLQTLVQHSSPVAVGRADGSVVLRIVDESDGSSCRNLKCCIPDGWIGAVLLRWAVILGVLWSVQAVGMAADEAVPAIEEAISAPDSSSSMFSTEVWLTPLILLPGVALLIVSTSARFGQLHTEFHRLLDHPDAHARILSQHLLKRSTLFRDALLALYASVGLFAIGSLLGGVVNLWRPDSLWVVGTATMFGICCIAYASIQLMRETLLCLSVLKDHREQLQAAVDDELC